MTLLIGIDLDQYKTRAKELVKEARAGEPIAVRACGNINHRRSSGLPGSSHLASEVGAIIGVLLAGGDSAGLLSGRQAA